MSKKKQADRDDDAAGPLKEEQRAVILFCCFVWLGLVLCFQAYLESMKDFWQKQLESIDRKCVSCSY